MQKTHHQIFKFLDWQLDVHNHELSLSYHLENVGKVTESLNFPAFDSAIVEQNQNAINQACQLIHLMCGVSYYKAGLAENIVFENYQPNKNMHNFMLKTWKHGLAEMMFLNGVINGVSTLFDTSLLFQEGSVESKRVLTPLKILTAIGGGKDSLVTIEELKQQNKDIILFYVGQSALIKKVVDFTQLPVIQVRRKIDPKLINYNKKGAFNGHIPITAINSSIAILSALLFGCNAVVFSNERSADSANTTNSAGQEVNHQYSKSYAFEKDISAILQAEISQDIIYYSQQRRFSELAILKKFSQYKKYFPVFSSCNRNFHIDGSKNKQTLWCCDCPKCRFVFLGLAPFIKKDELLTIFGNNLLNDASQKNGFEQLLGVSGFKPFECVGEIQESQLAFNLIQDNKDWKNDCLIKYFSQLVPKVSADDAKKIMLKSES